MRFRAILHSVLMQRRGINHRYSLRSLARALRIDHATLSQLMRGERRITGRTIRCLGPRLGLTAHQVEECRTLEHEVASSRYSQIRAFGPTRVGWPCN